MLGFRAPLQTLFSAVHDGQMLQMQLTQVHRKHLIEGIYVNLGMQNVLCTSVYLCVFFTLTGKGPHAIRITAGSSHRASVLVLGACVKIVILSLDMVKNLIMSMFDGILKKNQNAPRPCDPLNE